MLVYYPSHALKNRGEFKRIQYSDHTDRRFTQFFQRSWRAHAVRMIVPANAASIEPAAQQPLQRASREYHTAPGRWQKSPSPSPVPRGEEWQCPVGAYSPVRKDIHYHVNGTELADRFYSPFPFSLSGRKGYMQ
jgi:hypothetical protein